MYSRKQEIASSKPGPSRVLIVDDDETTRHEMVRILMASNPLSEICEAADGVTALHVLADEAIDLVIVDLVMPRMDGIKLLTAIRRDDRLAHTPVIVVTSTTDIGEKLLSFERGAQDFLTKPVQPAELVARVRVMLTLRGQMLVLQERSSLDPLTGLYNQTYLWEALGREIERSRRHRLNLSCLMIDVDNFKAINDRFGHLGGDEVLRTIARVLRSNLRQYDFAVRYGGDEFLTVFVQNSAEGTRIVAERIRETVELHPFFPHQRPPNPVRVTIGIAAAAAVEIRSSEMIVEAADKALYQAKLAGKNQVRMAVLP